MTIKTLLLELAPLDTTTGLNKTIRLTDRNAPASVTLMDAGWLPAIVDDVEFQYSIWADGSPTPMSTSFGSVTISLEHVLRTHDLTRLHFDGAVATIWLGDAGAPFFNFTRVFTGAMGPLIRDDDRSAKITLLGPESALVRDLLTDSFQGTGNIEGPAEMAGRLKPVAFGAVTNVEPILIDAASLIYMVDAASPVTAVFENALTLDVPAATLDSFTALKSATIAPGKWARAPGMFRLGSQPSGKITADAGTASTVNATIVSLLRRAGIADAKIGDTIRQASVAYNLYVTDQTTILDAVRNAAFAAGQYLIADAAGVWHLAPFVSTKVAGRLSADQSSDPIVLPDTIRALPAAAPAWRVKVAHSRVWSVNSSSEISPALRDQAAAIAAVTKAADDAADVADSAMADAIFARARVENQAKDGVLDRTEKLQLVRDFEGYTAERGEKIATGQGLGVTTEVAAYVTAYANLKSYLEGLNPAYNDTSADTLIDGSVYRAMIPNYLAARSNLDNANANHAAQRANWTGVEDRPTTLTALDLAAGTKLDTVEEGADVTGQNTAKDTSNVGGRPSSSIVAGIDKLPDIRADIDKALAAGQAVADREQAAATPPDLVSNIQWSSTLTDVGADVTLTWTAAKDATSYEVELGENGGGGIVFAAPSTSYRFAAKRNTAYSARVRALKINVPSGWVSAPAFSTGRDTVAPAAPTGLSAVGGITWIDVATVAPADADQAKIRFTLYRSGDNAKIGDATVSATANTRAETRFANLTRATAYYVSAVALDSSDNVSATTANVPVATTGGVSLDDLTPGLVPPQTVPALPSPSGWTGSPVVFYAGELYRLSNGAWTKSVSGQDIAASTIATDKLVNNAITEEKIAASAITAGKIAANAITANRLTAANRPVSVFGMRFRVDNDGYLRWGSGYIQYTNDNGSYTSTFVSGNELAPQPYTNYVFYTPDGRNYFDYTSDENILNNQNVIMIGRWHGNKEGFVPLAGVGTLINGDQIVTGSVNANKIIARTITADQLAANSITANEIAAGTITAAQIATSALTARVLAVGNPDNIIGDSGYNDASWWNGGNADGRLTVGESGMIETGRELKVTSSGRSDFYSMFFPVELGATYRVSVGVYTYGDFNGRFRPVIHMPNWAWLNLKAGTGVDPEDSNPSLNWTSASSYFRNEFVVTNPANTLECKKWQFRLIGDWSGTLAFVCKIVRVSDTTLIKDGAITTDKITVNSLNGDRIQAGTLNADRIIAGSVLSNQITVAGTSGNLGDAVERARDPAYRINNGVGTQISPGLINISGGTTLASWRNGGDNTKIEGGSIAANTITANKLTVGNRNLTFGGFSFEYNEVANSLQWSIGYVTYIDQYNNALSSAVQGGSRAWNGGTIVGYWREGSDTIQWSNLWEDANRDNTVRLIWWNGGSNFTVDYGSTIINGDRITTGSIDANRIKANTVLASTVVVGGRGTVDSAFDSAKWSGVSGAGKPLTFTVGARGNQTSSLPSGYNHGLRGPDGQVYWDGSYPNLRTDAYNRSYTVCWTNGGEVWGIRHFDVYGNGTVSYEGGYGSSAGSMAQLLRDIAFGSTIVIYTSDEPSNNRLNDGLPAEMYNCGASRSVFGSANFPSWSSYILIGQKGVGEGNGTEYFSAGGANSYVRATFSIVNGVPSIGGASIKDARDLAFSDGRGVDVLRGVQENATVGAPSGTYVGNSLAQTVEGWANTGAQDPAGRINAGTTTINGGRITTGSITANQIAANTITADRLNVASLSALSANIGDVTAGVVRNASGSAKFDLTAGRIVFDNGSVMKVSGNGFGSSSQFIEWFGPRQSNLSNCTEQNASYYLKTDGSSYFGGSLSAGTIKNAIGTSSTATNASVTTGDVGSRGGSRVVVLSYSWSWTQPVDKFQNEGSGHDLSAQIVLSRNGADVATLTASGEWYRDPAASANEPGYYTESIGGSLTFTDNLGGSSVNYSARLTVRNTGPGPQNGSTRPGVAQQRISIVQTEQ